MIATIDHHVSRKASSVAHNCNTKHRTVVEINFDNDKSITWYFIDGSTKKVAPFKYHPKRNIGDQFMNANNDIVTTILTCNNNVTIDDKTCFFYVTLY